MSDCIGGWDFYDDTHNDEKGALVNPIFVNREGITSTIIDNPDTKILEINSKTGLYPLYMCYSVFAEKCKQYRDKHMLTTDIPYIIRVSCKTQLQPSPSHAHNFISL